MHVLQAMRGVSSERQQGRRLPDGSDIAMPQPTLATGLPATALTGLDLHQLDFNKRFRYLIVVPPLPRLSQRELVVADQRS
jgi:hypothetical protein